MKPGFDQKSYFSFLSQSVLQTMTWNNPSLPFWQQSGFLGRRLAVRVQAG